MRRAIDLAAGTVVLALIGASALAAQRLPAGLPASAALLLRYDANHDGVVTRDEMEAGLKVDFAAADTNGDGCLGPAEVRAENDRRLARDGELSLLPASAPTVEFVPVEIVPEGAAPGTDDAGVGIMVIELPGERRVRVDRHVDAEALRRVLLALGFAR